MTYSENWKPAFTNAKPMWMFVLSGLKNELQNFAVREEIKKFTQLIQKCHDSQPNDWKEIGVNHSSSPLLSPIVSIQGNGFAAYEEKYL